MTKAPPTGSFALRGDRAPLLPDPAQIRWTRQVSFLSPPKASEEGNFPALSSLPTQAPRPCPPRATLLPSTPGERFPPTPKLRTQFGEVAQAPQSRAVLRGLLRSGGGTGKPTPSPPRVLLPLPPRVSAAGRGQGQQCAPTLGEGPTGRQERAENRLISFVKMSATYLVTFLSL